MFLCRKQRGSTYLRELLLWIMQHLYQISPRAELEAPKSWDVRARFGYKENQLEVNDLACSATFFQLRK